MIFNKISKSFKTTSGKMCMQAIDNIMNTFNLPFSDSRYFNKTT